MAKMVYLSDGVYAKFDDLKSEIKKEKEKSNQKGKTTFSEVLALLINSYKSKMVSGQ